MEELSKYSAGSAPSPTSFHHSQMMALIFPPSSPLTYSVMPASFLVASRPEEPAPPRSLRLMLRRNEQRRGLRAAPLVQALLDCVHSVVDGGLSIGDGPCQSKGALVPARHV